MVLTISGGRALEHEPAQRSGLYPRPGLAHELAGHQQAEIAVDKDSS